MMSVNIEEMYIRAGNNRQLWHDGYTRDEVELLITTCNLMGIHCVIDGMFLVELNKDGLIECVGLTSTPMIKMLGCFTNRVVESGTLWVERLVLPSAVEVIQSENFNKYLYRDILGIVHATNNLWQICFYKKPSVLELPENMKVFDESILKNYCVHNVLGHGVTAVINKTTENIVHSFPKIRE